MSQQHWDTRLTRLLGISFPLIQGPLGGLSTQRLAATVSTFGGLGSFGAHTYTPEGITEVITEIRSLTSKPFAMNLWVSMEDDGARGSDERAFRESLVPLAPHLQRLGVPLPSYTPYTPQSFERQARALIDAGAPVFSFIFGIPPREILDECRAKQIPTIGAATTVEEAIALEQAGVDAVAASGFEGGGHRGSFLRRAEDSLVGTMALVPQVVDAVRIPVIAAGGIADARGVLAAFALGAEGVQMGTVFLSSDASGASELHRAALRSPAAGQTNLTRGFTGRLARGIQNQLMEDLNRSDAPYLPYPLQRALLKPLVSAATQAGRADLVQLWAGQAARLAIHPDPEVFLQSLVAELDTLPNQIFSWQERRSRARQEIR